MIREDITLPIKTILMHDGAKNLLVRNRQKSYVANRVKVAPSGFSIIFLQVGYENGNLLAKIC